MRLTKTLLATTLCLPLALPAFAEGHMSPDAVADVQGPEISGTVGLNNTLSGRTLVQIDLSGVPEGVHGVHLHETGDCSAPDFTSAGGHIAGDQMHGVLAENGPHPGDMPNMTVGADGVLKADVFLELLDMESMIMDGDGAAFIVHSGADDYTSQPSGDAGSRIACGVFMAAD
ncbi:superoxide dismutase family protein [Pseudosulfitobacter koreensis]|uniref:Superoxide dismutase family protein n=1 Tax=Pseudosulfitobacter koreensis TaxID=2968472 RepID=A0ABT1Z3E9_9RHOB|nr:superoxide dismutase family protein [Pseudosulfitobacter koreense]MCR8827658.1 superoxide dismutase family protein [Pseudosulfitobacter koreense]